MFCQRFAVARLFNNVHKASRLQKLNVVRGITTDPKEQDSSNFDNITGGSFKLNDGNKIPLIGLGISRIVGQNSLDSSVDAALKHGYRLFDTATLYDNEEELGTALQKNLPKYGLSREDIFITTKVGLTNSNFVGFAKKHIQESLEKLKTSYIDLLLIHYPRDRSTPGKDEEHEVNKRGRKEVWGHLELLKKFGTARSIGVSNYQVSHLEEMESYAKITPAVNQCEYTPYFTNNQIRSYCRQKRIFFQAYSSLCWGNQDILNEQIVKQLTKKYNTSPQTILYAFAHSNEIGIIPKSATPERIKSNLQNVAAIKLTQEELAAMADLDRNLSFCPRCDPWNCL